MEEDKSGEAKKMSPSVPYIGATMDVVTKSSARYLGVLASINVAESTITLTQGGGCSGFLLGSFSGFTALNQFQSVASGWRRDRHPRKRSGRAAGECVTTSSSRPPASSN